MKRNTAIGSPRPCGEEGRRFSQDVALHRKALDLAAKVPQLVALLGRQSLAPAGVDVALVDPVAERLVGDPELVCDLGDGLVRGADELDRPLPELIGVGRM